MPWKERNAIDWQNTQMLRKILSESDKKLQSAEKTIERES